MPGDVRKPSLERAGPARRGAGGRGPLVLASWLALAGVAFPQQSEPPPPPDGSTAEADYVATPGLRLGRTGLTIGAFTTLELDKETGRPSEVALDSVNALVLWEPFEFVKAFGELEIGPLLTWHPSRGSVESEPELRFERLYVDVSGGDTLNVRLGKFQTPVGIWNLVSAEPFTWTATSPVLVDAAFDEHQTGGAVFGSFYPGRSNVEYWIYGQFVNPLDAEEESSDRAVGGRLRIAGARNEWAVGASYLASSKNGAWSHLGGVDFSWVRGPLEVQGEMASVRGDIPGRDLWDAYLQAVYGLGAHARALRGLSLVARYERFSPSGPVPRSHIGNLGLAWIPKRWLNLKLGHQFVDKASEHVGPGTFASVSVIF